jgi:hypothetical protein
MHQQTSNQSQKIHPSSKDIKEGKAHLCAKASPIGFGNISTIIVTIEIVAI